MGKTLYFKHIIDLRLTVMISSFKGAYCTVWEKEPCTDLFGSMDVMEDSFPEMARKIVAASKAASGS